MPSLPFFDLRHLDAATARRELLPSFAGTMMSVPQGVAYAMIAGLPPAMGLYAAAIPAVVGSLLRSSKLVVVGPTNAISLVLASSAVASLEDPAAAAATLALMVGVLQIAAGRLRLSALVDFLSSSVVAGYLTGAATLILVGQLPNVTGTSPGHGDLFTRLWHWLATAREADPVSVALAGGTVAVILGLRQAMPKGVPAVLAMAASIAVTWGLHLPVATVGDLAPIPRGLPPLTVPRLTDAAALAPVAVAAMVLSLVESSSVSRALATKTGQRVDPATDFTGLGAANVAAAFFGGYPVSGSLARSSLNVALGARTRLAGALSGVWVLLVPLGLAPVLDQTPIPALAGILLVVASDLLDVELARTLLRMNTGDRAAFAATVLGTWLLPLDQAIYAGVGISIVLFLRRARMLVVHEMRVDDDLRLREVLDDDPPPDARGCGAIRLLHVEGALFFGSASELESELDERIDDPAVQVLVVRLKRAQGMDFTTASVLKRAYDRMEASGRRLMLVGMREDVLRRLEGMGLAEAFAPDALLPTRPGWFAAMNRAIAGAVERVDRSRCPSCGAGGECPLRRYVEHRAPGLQCATSPLPRIGGEGKGEGEPTKR